jgi:hypothetical protein
MDANNNLKVVAKGHDTNKKPWTTYYLAKAPIIEQYRELPLAAWHWAIFSPPQKKSASSSITLVK